MTLIQLIAWVILEPIIYGPLMSRGQVLRVVSSEHFYRTVISSIVRTSRWGGRALHGPAANIPAKILQLKREEDQYLFMREKKKLI